MYQILQYIKFLFRSKNQHGVHSPFVFNLVTECFYNKRDFKEYKIIKNYRSNLLKNNSRIIIEDLGAGSRVSNSTSRKISSIARTSGSSFRQSQFLFRLVNFLKPKNILELGTSLGISTKAMSLANPSANITTIEGSESLWRIAKENGTSNATFLQGSFTEELLKLKEKEWDMVFFDGDHSKTGTLQYFETLLPFAHNDSVFIFDDIYWSKEMTEAWEIIKKHPKVTVTIDTFFKGLVFFRHEQAKEHFRIRVW